MPFVVRDNEGQIVALRARPTADAQEEISANSPEILEFLAGAQGKNKIQQNLARSDSGMVRVFEDLLYVLIEKRILMLTDLPLAAREKLALRHYLRDNLLDLGGIVATSEEAIFPEK